MFKTITCNAYYFKGKIHELETSTGEGKENDLALARQEKIIPAIRPALSLSIPIFLRLSR